MHVYPSSILGILVWSGLVVAEYDQLWAWCSAPFVVSATIVAACFAPGLFTPSPRRAASQEG